MTKPDGSWPRQRDPWPVMTLNMFEVLSYLKQAKEQDWPFVPLPDVGKRTLNSLVSRDWVFESVGLDGVRYGITERGERAYKAYTEPVRRTDDLCPTCGIRPRHVSESGRKDGYCLECANEYKRRAYKLKRPGKSPDSLCPRCKKRPRHIYASGRPCTYCLHCKNVRNRRRKKQDRQRAVQLARQGVVKLCARPGCTRPRHVSPSGVLDWCREHYREWYNDYRHKKKAGKPKGRIGRPPKNQVQP